MNHAKWIAKRNQLCSLIKKVSDAYGGDDVEWLREYCKEIIANYPGDEIDKAIVCFVSLEEQLKYVSCRTMEKK